MKKTYKYLTTIALNGFLCLFVALSANAQHRGSSGSSSGGGGGYGPAWQRDVARVLRDVSEGYVSMEAAEQDYGVVLRADGSLDEAATRTRRAAMASAS